MENNPVEFIAQQDQYVWVLADQLEALHMNSLPLQKQSISFSIFQYAFHL